ncbi:MAG: GNAT family N-acetyltransferase [Methanomassiliicoccales archaeon]|nr:GNAT family N-acetyltransferase [Methanomassiliicoccales archaeon]
MVFVRLLRSEDVPAAQRLMADTWSNMLKRQTGLELPYPVRPAIWYSARLAHEPMGCMCLEEEGRIVGTGFCLSCGSVGWIGPMEISPPFQGRGFGTQLLQSLEIYLGSKGCKAVGLETMKDVAENVTFYTSGGYIMDQDMLYMEKDWLEGQDGGRPQKDKVNVKEIRRLASTISPGFDPSKEFILNEEIGSGRTFHGEGATALLLWDPIPGSGKAYIRTLLSEGYHCLNKAIELIQKMEREALWAGSRSIFTIIPSDSELVPYMLRGGYKPKGVDVRLMKGKFPRNHECSIISWSG